MFKGWQVVMIAMLVWGNLSFAALPKGEAEPQELQTISSWMAHLNHYYPELQVAPAADADLNNPEERKELMQDLNALEELMGRGASLPDASLKQIACGRPECTGGGGGNCTSCEVGKD